MERDDEVKIERCADHLCGLYVVFRTWVVSNVGLETLLNTALSLDFLGVGWLIPTLIGFLVGISPLGKRIGKWIQ